MEGAVVRTVRRLFISVHIEFIGNGHVLVRSLLEVGVLLEGSLFTTHDSGIRTVIVLV